MSNDKQSSSIDWIINQVQDNMGDIPLDIQEIAKEMHKEEHRKTYYQGVRSNFHDFYGYYIETFGDNNEKI